MATKSTFEREMENPKFKKAFEESYHEFLLSELLIALMEKDDKTVRQLAIPKSSVMRQFLLIFNIELLLHKSVGSEQKHFQLFNALRCV